MDTLALELIIEIVSQVKTRKLARVACVNHKFQQACVTSLTNRKEKTFRFNGKDRLIYDDDTFKDINNLYFSKYSPKPNVTLSFLTTSLLTYKDTINTYLELDKLGSLPFRIFDIHFVTDDPFKKCIKCRTLLAQHKLTYRCASIAGEFCMACTGTCYCGDTCCIICDSCNECGKNVCENCLKQSKCKGCDTDGICSTCLAANPGSVCNDCVKGKDLSPIIVK